MTIKNALTEIRGIFKWYFDLTSQKRIQVNYIMLLLTIGILSYYNDKQHKANYLALSNRIDNTNNSRSLEQANYTKKLEYYTDKFNHLLELLIKEGQERKKIEEVKTTRNK